jgi:hypothetical protein
VFGVFLCFTVQRECLLSLNTRDYAVLTVKTPTRKEDAILKIIDNVLNQVFGKEATHFIYKYLEHNYALRRSEFSDKIEVFAKGLEDCLSSGAFIVESKILDHIYSHYGAFCKTEFTRIPEGYDFASKMKIAMEGTEQALYSINSA